MNVYVTGKLFVGGIDVIARTIEYPKDSGWIAINVQNCGITTKLYVRQVGKIVIHSRRITYPSQWYHIYITKHH